MAPRKAGDDKCVGDAGGRTTHGPDYDKSLREAWGPDKLTLRGREIMKVSLPDGMGIDDSSYRVCGRVGNGFEVSTERSDALYQKIIS